MSDDHQLKWCCRLPILPARNLQTIKMAEHDDLRGEEEIERKAETKKKKDSIFFFFFNEKGRPPKQRPFPCGFVFRRKKKRNRITKKKKKTSK